MSQDSTTFVAKPTRRRRFLARLDRHVFGVRPPVVVPDRVLRAIARAQDTSEVLVCFVQLTAIATFALLYSLTPKAFPPTVPFEPVPITLSVYAAFTLLRLHFAMKRRMRPWFLSLSVIVDVSVLMLTIWSFHLQYEAPAGAYIKAPTIAYVFILVVLRALRFEVRYILLTGFCASAGWLLLVGYAAAAPEVHITRDYLRYMTSFDILLGAEFDKIVAIGMVTAILSVAIVRARRLLVSAVTEQATAIEMSRFFAPEVAQQIRTTETVNAPGSGVIRNAAVLVLDLRGFTKIAHELAPGDVITLLGTYQSLVVPIVQKHGGSIDKYMGDGILATFGATRPLEDYAAAALAAGIETMKAVETWSSERQRRGEPTIRVGAAIATGPLLFGTIGSDNRLEFTVIGDPVNLAAKLEKHTKTEKVRLLATREAVELARAQGFSQSVLLRQLPNRNVEGVATPLDLFSFD